MGIWGRGTFRVVRIASTKTYGSGARERGYASFREDLVGGGHRLGRASLYHTSCTTINNFGELDPLLKQIHCIFKA